MARERMPAERLNPADIVGTFRATMGGAYAARSYHGVTGVVLSDGRRLVRCNDCALAWETAAAVMQHRRRDVPHVPEGTTPPLVKDPKIDTYVSSESAEPSPGAELALADAPERPEVPVRQAPPRRRGDVDPEVFLDVQAGAMATSMIDFMHTLVQSRTAAREQAERAIRGEQEMRKLLITMRDMIDKALGANDE